MITTIKEILMAMATMALMVALFVATGLHDIVIDKLVQDIETSTTIPRLQMEFNQSDK